MGASTNGRTGGRVITVNKPKEDETPTDGAPEKAASGMPEITIAMLEAVRDSMLKCKSFEDTQAWWKANFGTFGYKKLGRILANPQYDLSKLVRA